MLQRAIRPVRSCRTRPLFHCHPVLLAAAPPVAGSARVPNTPSMQIAVIGAGNIGGTLAKKWAAAGHTLGHSNANDFAPEQTISRTWASPARRPPGEHTDGKERDFQGSARGRSAPLRRTRCR